MFTDYSNLSTHSPTRNDSLQKVNQLPGFLFLSKEEVEAISSLLDLESRHVHPVSQYQLLQIEECLLVRSLVEWEVIWYYHLSQHYIMEPR